MPFFLTTATVWVVDQLSDTGLIFSIYIGIMTTVLLTVTCCSDNEVVQSVTCSGAWTESWRRQRCFRWHRHIVVSCLMIMSNALKHWLALTQCARRDISVMPCWKLDHVTLAYTVLSWLAPVPTCLRGFRRQHPAAVAALVATVPVVRPRSSVWMATSISMYV